MGQKTRAQLIEEIAALQARIARLEDRLRHAQKTETVGRLAGGVAHDFNNLLMPILGCSELLLERLGEQDPVARKLVTDIQEAGASAAELTRHLLAFSRQQPIRRKALDLNALVANLERMLRRILREDIRLVTALDPSLGQVHADPGQLEQLIVILAANARDAMPTGGTLTLTTKQVQGSGRTGAGVQGSRGAEERGSTGAEVDSPQHPSPPAPQQFVELSVTDTGSGITDGTDQHLFESCLTSGQDAEGTGLSLATIQGIVSQSGGHIAVESEVGRGSTFRIRLPAVGEATEAAEPPMESAAPAGGGETILLVEDVPVVRKLIREILGRHGYAVLEAQHGREALVLAEAHRDPIHLLLTDVVMPEMDGRELADRLAVPRPEMKVLFMSAHAEAPILHRRVPEAGITFLQKPFTPSALARKVREILGR